jgi:hypothetical protein
MKILNLFFALIVISFFTNSCTPGIKLSNGKKIEGRIGTTPADVESLSKAEMRSANADVTHSVANFIDSIAVNPDKYENWKDAVVIWMQQTKDPDDKVTTYNQNYNFNAASGLSRNGNSSSGKNIVASEEYDGYNYDTKGERYYSADDPDCLYPIEVSFLKTIIKHPEGELAKEIFRDIKALYPDK